MATKTPKRATNELNLFMAVWLMQRMQSCWNLFHSALALRSALASDTASLTGTDSTTTENTWTIHLPICYMTLCIYTDSHTWGCCVSYGTVIWSAICNNYQRPVPIHYRYSTLLYHGFLFPYLQSTIHHIVSSYLYVISSFCYQSPTIYSLLSTFL